MKRPTRTVPGQVMPSDVGQRLPWSFPLSPRYWRQRWRQTAAKVAAANERRRRRHGTGLSSAAPSASSLSSRDSQPAVRIEGLRKVFRTTDGMQKVSRAGVRQGLRAGRRAVEGRNECERDVLVRATSALVRLGNTPAALLLGQLGHTPGLVWGCMWRWMACPCTSLGTR